MVCPPVREIIHSLKLVDYLHVQADKPWYNYYIKLHTIKSGWDIVYIEGLQVIISIKYAMTFSQY